MKATLPSPAADESRERQADWMELFCIAGESDTASMQDFVRELRRSGTVKGEDRGSEESESIAQDVLSELDNRARACGELHYPFDVTAHSIRRRVGYLDSPYIFQLVLSHFGIVKRKGLPSPERVFEHIAAHAAGRYIGGGAPSSSLAFGFPRRHAAKNFRQALDELCRVLGECGGAWIPVAEPERTQRLAKIAKQKDGKLDIVAWRHFPDGRAGKLIGFGQCACGLTDWRNKVSELQPRAFLDHWLHRHFAVDPVRLFFVPRRVEADDWADVARDAGVLFDRCRISHHADGLSSDLVSECRKWTKYMLVSYKPKPRRKRRRAKKRKQ
jgi:hypothetical protein